jgi:hypothetical protein
VEQEIHLQLVHLKVNQVEQVQVSIIFQVLVVAELELLDKIDNLVAKAEMVEMEFQHLLLDHLLQELVEEEDQMGDLVEVQLAHLLVVLVAEVLEEDYLTFQVQQEQLTLVVEVDQVFLLLVQAVQG